MGHSYSSIRLHIVFSTKGRSKTIPPEMQPKLWAYVAGTVRKLGGQAFEVGGVGDHLHALVAAPATMSTSELIQKMKANSSRWMHENGVKRFEWQKGYGAFSVSASSTGAVREYIRRQEEHHRKHTFEEEFISLLRRYGIDYDPKFVFG